MERESGSGGGMAATWIEDTAEPRQGSGWRGTATPSPPPISARLHGLRTVRAQSHSTFGGFTHVEPREGLGVRRKNPSPRCVTAPQGLGIMSIPSSVFAGFLDSVSGAVAWRLERLKDAVSPHSIASGEDKIFIIDTSTHQARVENQPNDCLPAVNLGRRICRFVVKKKGQGSL